MSVHRSKAPRGVAVGVSRRTFIDLAALDALEAEAVGLFCWSDVRPLAGVAGYIDWRLCGALSETLQSRMFRGDAGEVLLVPVFGRFGPRRLFVFGLGPFKGWEAGGLSEACRHAYDVMRNAGVKKVVLAAPAVRQRTTLEAAFTKAVSEELPNQVEQVLLEKV